MAAITTATAPIIAAHMAVSNAKVFLGDFNYFYLSSPKFSLCLIIHEIMGIMQVGILTSTHKSES